MELLVVLGLVIVGLLVIVVGLLIVIYNRLVRLRNMVRSSWSDIDVQLKRRYNLVPNLTETVKAYAKHEREVFENVTKARNMAINAGTPGEQSSSENFLTQSLKSLFAVAEAYPELKADGNFLKLQSQFHELEDDIEAARRYYNAVVRDYNTSIEVFPAVMIASMLKFEKSEFFELDEPDEQRKPPKPDFS